MNPSGSRAFEARRATPIATPRAQRPPTGTARPRPQGPARFDTQGHCACAGTCPRCVPGRSALAALESLAARVNQPPGDAFEQQADHLARQAGLHAASPARELPTTPAPGSGDRTSARPAARADRLDPALAGPGRPLDTALRLDMERLLGHDFSSVRLHDGPVAARSARWLGAQAFTVGDAVVFGAGRHAPDSAAGRRLLAHELVHVAQQGQAPARPGAPPSPQGRAPGVQLMPAEPAATAPRSDGPRLQSDQPEVDGRDVFEVAGELLDNAWAYRDSVGARKAAVDRYRDAELEWAAKLEPLSLNPSNWLHAAIETLNSQTPPDPDRWLAALADWDDVRARLDAVLARPVGPETISALGLGCADALQHYLDTFEIVEHLGNEFLLYMEGFQRAAHTAAQSTGLARDIAFAGAVGVAVVVAAPVVAAGAATAVAGTGLTGTAATVATGGVTVAGLGTLGGVIEGGAQGAGALVVDNVDAVGALLDESLSWQDALDRFEFASAAHASWDGFKRGFVDGVLSFAGLRLESYLVGPAGRLVTRLVGEAASSTLAALLRSASVHALASGASNAVIGSLDAGLKAALDGHPLSEIESAMAAGFAAGLLIGGAIGAGSGALKGMAEVPDRLDRSTRPPDAAPKVAATAEAVNAHLDRVLDSADRALDQVWALMPGGKRPTVIIDATLGAAERGRYDSGLNTILISPDLAGELDVFETVWHEAFHARVRQLFPAMKGIAFLGDQMLNTHKNWIGIEETAAHAFGEAGRITNAAMTRNWDEVFVGIRRAWKAPTRAHGSVSLRGLGPDVPEDRLSYWLEAGSILVVIQREQELLVRILGLSVVAGETGLVLGEAWRLPLSAAGPDWAGEVDRRAAELP